jgi:hypothetical protein
MQKEVGCEAFDKRAILLPASPPQVQPTLVPANGRSARALSISSEAPACVLGILIDDGQNSSSSTTDVR